MSGAEEDRKNAAASSTCVVCREQISKGALKCVHCDSFQGALRRNLGFSVPVLGLLVAFLSILVSGRSELAAYFTTPRPALLVAVAENHENLFVMEVSNEGEAAGVVDSIECSNSFDNFDQTADRYWALLAPAASQIVRPQQMIKANYQVTYADVQKGVPAKSYSLSFVDEASACCGVPPATCSISVSTGTSSIHRSEFQAQLVTDWFGRWRDSGVDPVKQR